MLGNALEGRVAQDGVACDVVKPGPLASGDNAATAEMMRQGAHGGPSSRYLVRHTVAGAVDLHPHGPAPRGAAHVSDRDLALAEKKGSARTLTGVRRWVDMGDACSARRAVAQAPTHGQRTLRDWHGQNGALPAWIRTYCPSRRRGTSAGAPASVGPPTRRRAGRPAGPGRRRRALTKQWRPPLPTSALARRGGWVGRWGWRGSEARGGGGGGNP